MIEEQAVTPRPGERDERFDVEARARRIDASRFPLTAAAGDLKIDCSQESLSRHPG